MSVILFVWMSSKSVIDLAKSVDSYLRQASAYSPGVSTLSRFFEVAYFASLKTEEGKPLQLRIALVDPSNPDPINPRWPRADRWKITRMPNRLPYTIPNLVKLARAADPWSSSLAVYFEPDGTFFIWGLVDQTVHFNTSLVREGEAGGYAPPGDESELVIHGQVGRGGRQYLEDTRLAQDRLVRRQIDVFWQGPISDRLSPGIEHNHAAVLKSFGEDPPSEWDDVWLSALTDKWISTLCRILISIQRYRHGGALLLSTKTSDLDVKYPINYRRLTTALVNLGIWKIRASLASDDIFENYMETDKESMPVMLHLDETIAEGNSKDCESEITGCVRFISSLSCVDGLILANPDLSVRGFGVEIRTKKEATNVYLATRATAISKGLKQVDPNHFGTRHRSMMRYCMAHPHSLGFVISQDGDIRALARVGRRLVMWENLKVLSLWDPDFRRKARADKSEKNNP
jgi:hypothetical protein